RQYSLLHQRSQPICILLDSPIALRVGEYRDDTKSSQFENYALRLGQPGIVPQLQEQIAAPIECRYPASLNILDQPRLNQHLVTSEKTQRDRMLLKYLLHFMHTSPNLGGWAMWKLIIVMRSCNRTVDALLHE